MSEFNSNQMIRPISFQKIAEDECDNWPQIDSSRAKNKRKKNEKNKKRKEDFGRINRKHDRVQLGAENELELEQYEANFHLENSFPAVIFDRVCFKIDRSQQQSNFLDEILFKLRYCLPQSSNSQAESRQVDILKSINLQVPFGSIFGLLGPSSCGKTTLLRCLVGLLKANSGQIRLFGHNMRSHESADDDSNEFGKTANRSSRLRKLFAKSQSESSSEKFQGTNIERGQIPGSNVGYMPQDLGLYEDFTIRQLLTMFGQYVGMSGQLIRERIEFMAKFLDLPEVDREICSLSGGQKRRVSFAIACLHMPPLIILDEPTVGVDPLLRKSIWKYLRRLADEENKTIIITTHYIEEAAQADQVALMRAGEILIQDTPKRIMQSNGCKSLEEAFLKICNNVVQQKRKPSSLSGEGEGEDLEVMNGKLGKRSGLGQQLKLYPQSKFNWHDSLTNSTPSPSPGDKTIERTKEAVVKELKMRAQEKLALFDQLYSDRMLEAQQKNAKAKQDEQVMSTAELAGGKSASLASERPSMVPNILKGRVEKLHQPNINLFSEQLRELSLKLGDNKQTKASGNKINIEQCSGGNFDSCPAANHCEDFQLAERASIKKQRDSFGERLSRGITLAYALLYKNYRRNVNSLPLLAFQFMLPIIQMISFSLCVGGRPANIGLGLVNHDQLIRVVTTTSTNHLLGSLLIEQPNSTISSLSGSTDEDYNEGEEEEFSKELLSLKYLTFIDQSMLAIKPYANLKDALNDVRQAKLWAAMEIGENFTTTITKRFNLDNFYQLDLSTIQQSVIKLYPDRSNKILDMICHRSLVNSYRQFLLNQFEHFRKLPIDVKEPIFDIKPNLISNSIDGYTESIAAGLLASLTYIMAAGLTTFIMVVERSAGILERTFTSGINPVAYLIAHAIFRSLVMMIQIALVMFLTFYILKQPLVGSIWLAYLMLMTLNLTGIAYGLLISSLVTDQNGAALTIVSSLVVKLTMSGILWPFEAIPRWLRTICYLQPLTMPVQALKTITLKGTGLDDRTVQLGFVVSLTWLAIFLTIAAKRFKFYQH